MKKKIIVISLLFIFVIGLKAADRHVSVFYYPWYDLNRHWGEGYLRHLTNPVQEPLLGHYSNRDEANVERHLQWSQQYGIDNWICSWWGPDSWENKTILDYVSPNLEGSKVSYCLFYEAAGLLNMQNGRIEFDEQRTATFRAHIKFIAANYFDDPAYYRINGRPVVYIYLTRTFAGDYENAINAARQDVAEMGFDIFLIGDEVYWGSPNFTRIAALDGITAYNMHGPHEYDGYPMDTHFFDKVAEKYTAYRNIANLTNTAFIPKIMPGFNDRGVRLSADHYVIPSQVHPDSSHTSTFEHYSHLAEAFIDSNLNALCITSFNEWHEDTQIEPTIITDATSFDVSSEQVYTKGYDYTGYGMAYLEIIEKLFTDKYVKVDEKGGLDQPIDILLSNFPNPFNNVTEIQFRLKQRENIVISIYDISGHLVQRRELGDKSAGQHRERIEFTNESSGLYFYHVRGDLGRSEIKKMILVK
jgi:glycoprotein endo-alpha-1,2-mannosidase